jgi:hypothetical protein
MTELKLKLPIKIHKIDDGFIIVDSDESEFFFINNQETGKLDYDGCCVMPKRIDIIEEHLEDLENNPLKSLTKKRKLGKN